MIDWLLKRRKDRRRLDNFAAPADQTEEFESIDDAKQFFERLRTSIRHGHEINLMRLHRQHREDVEEWTEDRQRVLDAFLDDVITERDAEKALGVFDGLQEAVQAGLVDAPGQCCESKESAL